MNYDDFVATLAAPSRRALEGSGIHSWRGLCSRTEKDIAALHGIGPNALVKIGSGLRAEGLSLKEDRQF